MGSYDPALSVHQCEVVLLLSLRLGAMVNSMMHWTALSGHHDAVITYMNTRVSGLQSKCSDCVRRAGMQRARDICYLSHMSCAPPHLLHESANSVVPRQLDRSGALLEVIHRAMRFPTGSERAIIRRKSYPGTQPQ